MELVAGYRNLISYHSRDFVGRWRPLAEDDILPFD